MVVPLLGPMYYRYGTAMEQSIKTRFCHGVSSVLMRQCKLFACLSDACIGVLTVKPSSPIVADRVGSCKGCYDPVVLRYPYPNFSSTKSLALKPAPDRFS